MRALVQLLAPVRCAACGRDADGDLCASCAHDLIPLVAPLCPRCGAPGTSCGSCGDLQAIRRARSLVLYGGPASRLTLALKRRGRPGLARELGALLGDLARLHDLVVDGLVAHVPAGRGARTKGFDHAELLARGVAAALGVRHVPLLARAREGPRQADVPLALRQANAADRFRARPTTSPVLLVDDVFTTGATAEACAGALRAAGAEAVDVLTFARTPRLGPRR